MVVEGDVRLRLGVRTCVLAVQELEVERGAVMTLKRRAFCYVEDSKTGRGFSSGCEDGSDQETLGRARVLVLRRVHWQCGLCGWKLGKGGGEEWTERALQHLSHGWRGPGTQAAPEGFALRLTLAVASGVRSGQSR